MLPRPFLIPAVCALTALASACDDNSVRISSSRSENNDATGVLRVIETLQCPQTIGSLTRKGSATEQGTVCTYNGPKGAEVVLHLVSLRGTDAATALQGFETRLSTSLPDAAAQIRASASSDAATASASSNDTASVRAPGVAIDANGDNASVRAPALPSNPKATRPQSAFRASASTPTAITPASASAASTSTPTMKAPSSTSATAKAATRSACAPTRTPPWSAPAHRALRHAPTGS